MPERIRRAGAPWRILVHEILPGGGSGDSTHVASDRTFGGGGEDRTIHANGRDFHERHIELPGTDFDELVIGRQGFLHVEQMDEDTWWLSVGGVVIHVTADEDGRATRVLVEGPGDNDYAVPGCVYELVWSRR